jgi:hypothetical protein
MAAHAIPILLKTFTAAGDLSSAQYKIMKQSADNTVTTCTGATDLPVGILQNAPSAAGQPAIVMIVGISPVSADAALSVGAQYGTSADGQADAKTVGTDTTEYIIGQVLQASTAAGDHIACTVNCLNPHRAA